MAAIWQKNEPIATKRRCDLYPVALADGTLAPRSTDFTGFVWIARQRTTDNTPDYALAAGTVRNKRRKITFADLTIEAATESSDQLTITGHGLETGDGPVLYESTLLLGTPIPDLVSLNEYYVIKIDDDHIQLADTLADAYAGTPVDITGDVPSPILDKIVALNADRNDNVGSPTTSVTSRGIDGKFEYQATQLETNVDLAEMSVYVNDGTYEAYTSVDMIGSLEGFNALGEGANTYGDMQRAMYAILAGLSGDYTTGTYTFKDPTTGTITRFTFTATAAGRIVATPGDLSGP